MIIIMTLMIIIIIIHNTGAKGANEEAIVWRRISWEDESVDLSGVLVRQVPCKNPIVA